MRANRTSEDRLNDIDARVRLIVGHGGAVRHAIMCIRVGRYQDAINILQSMEKDTLPVDQEQSEAIIQQVARYDEGSPDK